MTNYLLSSPGGLEAARASLRFLDIGPWEVTAPLLACAYLAPFADLCRINFSLWLYGPSGSFKSTLAALALSHFGKFDVCSLPIDWISTVNSLGKTCFVLKDTLAVIDDFKPPTTGKGSKGQMEKAGQLIYQVGNRSARGRLTRNLENQPNYYPRCLIISTGELLLPGQRQSGTARYLGVELDPKKTPIDKARLTAAQGEAHLYAGAMAAYLEDLAPRLDDVREEIRELWEAYRGVFQGTAHLRIPETLAWPAVGFDLFLRFQVRMGGIADSYLQYEMEKKARGVFVTLGEAHTRRIEGELPTLKFLSNLNELLLTSKIYLESTSIQGAKPPRAYLLGWVDDKPANNAYMAGYADDETLFLLPETVMRTVNKAIQEQGDYLSLGKNEMLAALAREGFIEVGKDGKNTRSKWLQGGSKRVICLPRRVLGHDEVEDGQITTNPTLLQKPTILTPSSHLKCEAGKHRPGKAKRAFRQKRGCEAGNADQIRL